MVKSVGARVRANYCEFHIYERPQMQKGKETTASPQTEPLASQTARNWISHSELNHPKLDSEKRIFLQINQAINFPSFSER